MNRDRKLELALKRELRAAGTPDRDACVDAETLGAWADGGLDAVQMAIVESHVAGCGRCQAIVGVTARSAPAPAVSEVPAGASLWKWWLAPIAAGAAAVTLWMVVPQETIQAPPAPVAEASIDAPAESQAVGNAPARDTAPPAAPAAETRLADAIRPPSAPAVPSGRDRRERNEEFLERKPANRTVDQGAIGLGRRPGGVHGEPARVGPARDRLARCTPALARHRGGDRTQRGCRGLVDSGASRRRRQHHRWSRARGIDLLADRRERRGAGHR